MHPQLRPALAVGLLTVALAPQLATSQETATDDDAATTEVAQVMQAAASDVASIAVQAELIANSLSEVVGTAISPLVGVGAIGAFGYYRADAAARATLPWYNHPWCWGSIIGVLILVALKETLGAAVPLVKKPLDALELVENKVSAVVAAPVVLQELVRRLTPVAEALVGELQGRAVPVVHAATAAPGTASADSFLEVLSLAISATLATVIFFVVWLSGHVVNVLVFLNPISVIDWMMKSGRLAVMGLVVGATALHPGLGVFVCLVIFAISLWMFGWSFRLMTVGSVCSWDLLARRSTDVAAEDGRFLAFAANLPAVPPRTLGNLLRRGDGSLEFEYRRFLVMPRRSVPVPPPSGQHEIGDGLLSPLLLDAIDADSYRIAVRLAPRYRKQARELAAALDIELVRDVSIARGFSSAWRWVRSQFGDPSTPVRA